MVLRPTEPTLDGLLDALEADFPMLRGNVRDPRSKKRRPLVRFFACETNLSHQPGDQPLPKQVLTGVEALQVGAMAGG